MSDWKGHTAGERWGSAWGMPLIREGRVGQGKREGVVRVGRRVFVQPLGGRKQSKSPMPRYHMPTPTCAISSMLDGRRVAICSSVPSLTSVSGGCAKRRAADEDSEGVGMATQQVQQPADKAVVDLGSKLGLHRGGR